MSDLEIGQVLWLVLRFNNNGDVSKTRHPYLIVDIDDCLGTIELAQMDSLDGKEYKAFLKSNKVIYSDDPIETVVSKDGYAQLDNTFLIEQCSELACFRKTNDKLSAVKLNEVVNAYMNYHKTHHIDENKSIYITRSELLLLNPIKTK